MHRLAGAVDAALGKHERIELGRCVAAGHAAIGEIERGVRQVEEGIIACAPRGDDEGRRLTAFTPCEARRERHGAVAVRRRGREHVVVARNQPDLDARQRVRRGERVHEGMNAVGGGIGGEPVIGHDEPLRGPLAIAVVARHVGGFGGEQIDAGLHLRHRLADRESGGDILVELLLDLELAAPHLFALCLGDVLEVVFVEIALEFPAGHVVEQVAVADPIDGDLEKRRIDRDERDALLARARQHIGLRGEPHRRGSIAHIDRESGVLDKVFPHRGGETFAQRDVVGVAVLQPLDADLLIVHRERRLVVAGDRDER